LTKLLYYYLNDRLAKPDFIHYSPAHHQKLSPNVSRFLCLSVSCRSSSLSPAVSLRHRRFMAFVRVRFGTNYTNETILKRRSRVFADDVIDASSRPVQQYKTIYIISGYVYTSHTRICTSRRKTGKPEIMTALPGHCVDTIYFIRTISRSYFISTYF